MPFSVHEPKHDEKQKKAIALFLFFIPLFPGPWIGQKVKRGFLAKREENPALTF
jgi:hypothetical protein